MQRNFLLFCFISNVLMLAIILTLIISIIIGLDSVVTYINSGEFVYIRMFLGLFVLILWLFNLFIWSNNDRNLKRFFLLFFLIGIYSPFYFLKALKNKWI